jgi:class 3 adenylate cyclase
MTATRRLAAILDADVAGSSHLMGPDEEGTHERLKAHRRELLGPKIGGHSGRNRQDDRRRDADAIRKRPSGPGAAVVSSGHGVGRVPRSATLWGLSSRAKL